MIRVVVGVIFVVRPGKTVGPTGVRREDSLNASGPVAEVVASYVASVLGAAIEGAGVVKQTLLGRRHGRVVVDPFGEQRPSR